MKQVFWIVYCDEKHYAYDFMYTYSLIEIKTYLSPIVKQIGLKIALFNKTVNKSLSNDDKTKRMTSFVTRFFKILCK